MGEGLNIGVEGCGHVGLITGACLAHIGHWVTCVDNNARLITELGEGWVPFYEPGLEELLGGGITMDGCASRPTSHAGRTWSSCV